MLQKQNCEGAVAAGALRLTLHVTAKFALEFGKLNAKPAGEKELEKLKMKNEIIKREESRKLIVYIGRAAGKV